MRFAAHVLALLPLTAICWDIYFGQLSPNPIEDVTHRTGNAALTLLLVTHTITITRIITGRASALTFRRLTGLYTYFYAVLHAFIFFGVDYRFDYNLISDGIFTKPYVLAGLTALLLITPRAITSFRFGAVRLRNYAVVINLLVYPATAIAVLHFYWLLKKEKSEALVYLAMMAFLFVFRIPWVKSRFTRLNKTCP